ncbi:MAG: F0F1 ATP synthase subunit alpha, partial [Planctomycetota bacterium]
LGTELDKATQAQLDRGFRMVEILKQPQYKPMPITEEVVVIWAGGQGKYDSLPVDSLAEFEACLLAHIRDQFPEILQEIQDTGDFSSDPEANLDKAVEDFKKDFAAKLPSA